MAIELIKENIGYEQILGQNSADTVMKLEYVIPDTHPDVLKILMLDASPSLTKQEVMKDKIYVEGKVIYNVMYLAKQEDKMEVFNVSYTSKFTNSIELNGALPKMRLETECYVEHMDCNIINERKIGIEGIVKIKAEVYKKYDIGVVKDIKGADNIQFLKNPTSVDKIVGNVSVNMPANSTMKIKSDKPEIDSIVKVDINIHKRSVKILEDKVQVEAFALIGVLYKSSTTKMLEYVSDDVFISKEAELKGASSDMSSYGKFDLEAVDYNVEDNDAGERRIINVEALVKSEVTVMSKEDIEMIEDAYSPDMMMKMERKSYNVNIIHGSSDSEEIVKENIEIPSDLPKAESVIMCSGMACVTDKKIVEDKVIVEGIIKTYSIYKTSDKDKPLSAVSDEIPFSSTVEISGCKIDMQSIAKVYIESIDASVEANTIAVKAVVNVYANVSYLNNKDFLVNIVPDEGKIPKKNASITIYVVQSGDTLWKIAKKYYTTVDTLLSVNNIEDENKIVPGTKLIIPGRAKI